MLSLFVTILLAMGAHSSPQVVTPASGGPTGSGGGAAGGGKPPGAGGGDPVTGSGIPNVTNAINPTCIPWYGIRDAIMGGIFQGRCTDSARAAVRLAFHDAGTYTANIFADFKLTFFVAGTFSLALQAAGQPNGGADGSMLVDPNEVLRSENNGLQNIVSLLAPLPARFGVAPGDIVHLAGVLGVLACPGGPKVNVFVGREPPFNIAPENLLPSAEAPVADLLALFADKGFNAKELMALIGAHTTGKQRFVDTALANSSFDSTVTIWDTRFYTETSTNASIAGTFRLDSDVRFATDATTSADFTRFIGPPGAAMWLTDYAAAHLKMSLLGIDITGLTDCTEILPAAIDLTPLAVVTSTGGGSNKPVTDPVIDPIKLEAQIEQQRGIWLVPGSTFTPTT
ncbi:heme peroxidase [Mycena epipterygia]|nr:heme peroxidase [Mycena epipterygia]